jgi:hypothetical protein
MLTSIIAILIYVMTISFLNSMSSGVPVWNSATNSLIPAAQAADPIIAITASWLLTNSVNYNNSFTPRIVGGAGGISSAVYSINLNTFTDASGLLNWKIVTVDVIQRLSPSMAPTM